MQNPFHLKYKKSPLIRVKNVRPIAGILKSQNASYALHVSKTTPE
jgi:ubiquinone biosynthesis protein COQ9